jgi:hypothetical protein
VALRFLRYIREDYLDTWGVLGLGNGVMHFFNPAFCAIQWTLEYETRVAGWCDRGK